MQAACYAVLTRISLACDAAAIAKERHALASGLEKLSEHFTLRVFSLNYDDIPEHSSLRFKTGYERLYDGFVPATLFEPSPRHFHLQMHGSVLFGPDKRGKAILPRYESREEARNEWEVHSEEHVGADGRRILRCPW